MKILIVSRRYYPEVIGGGQISAHHIAQALVHAGHDVRVLTFVTDGQRKDETLDNVPITRLPIRVIPGFPRVSNLEWMYREMKLKTFAFLNEFTPDVIHALNGESVPSIAGVSRKTGIPFVATINGPNLFCFAMQGNDAHGNNCFGCKGRQRFRETMRIWGSGGILSKLKAFVYWLYSYPHMAVFTRAVKNADMLLPVSKDIFSRLSALGYHKLSIVHNPMDVHAKVKSELKKKLGIPATAPVLLFVGRVTESKGVQRMIRILPQLPKAHAVIIGKGDYISTVEHLAQDLKVNDRVHVLGFIENDKLAPYYSIGSVVLMVGTFYESLGRMLLEACSYGIPVIATNSSGNPDVIEHGKNGYLVSADDDAELIAAVQSILSNKKRANAMGTHGKAKIKREFSPQTVARQLTEIYRSIVRNRAP